MTRILESTSRIYRQDLKGLASILFFAGGIKVTPENSNEPEKLCHQVEISSNNVKTGPENPEQYETMAFTDEHKSSVYCRRVKTEGELDAQHLEATNHFKALYLNQNP